MIKTFSIALTGMLLSLALMQPASAATLQVANKTDKEAVITVTYHTNLCRDDRGLHAVAHETISLKPGLCTVKSVYASLKTQPGLALVCIPHKRTGASLYTITADKDYQNCYIN